MLVLAQLYWSSSRMLHYWSSESNFDLLVSKYYIIIKWKTNTDETSNLMKCLSMKAHSFTAITLNIETRDVAKRDQESLWAGNNINMVGEFDKY